MGEIGDGASHGEKPSNEVPDLKAYDAWAKQARDIFVERNSARASAFKDAGWKGQLVEMRKKLDRLWAVWQMDRALTSKDLDEAADLINATIFFLICVDEDNEDGKWPWP
jgi:hypothetical protein